MLEPISNKEFRATAAGKLCLTCFRKQKVESEYPQGEYPHPISQFLSPGDSAPRMLPGLLRLWVQTGKATVQRGVHGRAMCGPRVTW